MGSSARVLCTLLLFGCIDPLLQPCDEYVDYLCQCAPEECEERRQVFEGAGASLQSTCRVQLACFEDADLDGGQCHLFDEGREEECAP